MCAEGQIGQGHGCEGLGRRWMGEDRGNVGMWLKVQKGQRARCLLQI